jgi:hypothetical protein
VRADDLLGNEETGTVTLAETRLALVDIIQNKACARSCCDGRSRPHRVTELGPKAGSSILLIWKFQGATLHMNLVWNRDSLRPRVLCTRD